MQEAVSSILMGKLGPGASRGLGPGFAGAWGPAPQKLRLNFRRSEKSPGGRQAKGWETAETAAAEVGAWREAGTGYPPYPPLREKKRVFTLSVTETIQHAPQGRRIVPNKEPMSIKLGRKY